MSVSADIFQTWWRPRQVFRRHLARGKSEPFALSLLLTFLTLALVASLPNLARQSFLDGGSPILPRVLPAAMGLLATLPLFYLLAALGTLIARALGNKAGYFGGRIALFWAATATTPAMLALGVMQGLAGPGMATSLLGLALGLGFLGFWVLGLQEAGRNP